MRLLSFLAISELIIHAIYLSAVIEYDSYLLLTPRSIYQNTHMNWFGAILVYLIYFIFVPFYAITAFLIWLCTVGRK
jgi:hypothetical protein